MNKYQNPRTDANAAPKNQIVTATTATNGNGHKSDAINRRSEIPLEGDFRDF